MTTLRRDKRPIAQVRRAVIEIAFILFLFYANLLMGEFTASHASGKTISMALRNVITWQNMVIGVGTATAGFFFFEKLRRRL